MGDYCKANDVFSLVSIRDDETEDVESIIEKAEVDINSALGSMYEVPFTSHAKGIPPKIRWLCAELASCIIHSKEYDQGEINETDAGRQCYIRVNFQINQLITCKAALYYTDGTQVTRIGKCPDDSPGDGTTGKPLSNTIDQDAIFDLNPITDSNRVYYGGN